MLNRVAKKVLYAQSCLSQNRNSTLIQRNDIVCWRRTYLDKIKHFELSGRQNNRFTPGQIPSSKQLIVLHIRSVV